MLKPHFPNFLLLFVVYLGSLGRCHYYTHNDLVLEMLEYSPQKDLWRLCNPSNNIPTSFSILHKTLYMLHNNLGVIKHHDFTFHKADWIVQMIQTYYY